MTTMDWFVAIGLLVATAALIVADRAIARRAVDELEQARRRRRAVFDPRP